MKAPSKHADDLTREIEWCRQMCRHDGDNMCNQKEPCYVEDEKKLCELMGPKQ